MGALILLLLIFIEACSVLQVEIRDRPTRPKTTHREEYQVLRVAMPVYGSVMRDERGVFIKTNCGEFFRSVQEGTVLYAGSDLKTYGEVLVVNHGDFMTVYKYGRNLLVRKGERIRKGQVLGQVGRWRGQCGIGFEVRDQEGSPIRFEFLR
ncbi:Peptidase M23 [Thermocrinis albus DSM 14484]|uniref:Peptidase M23 n=1 Tax=Thermocrinis albus (strain DSM 14484 / JCM 11386 / HI 11/12) TaxID=638303 RepID=D3SNR0_THEAH|nr:peptidoglycan DD-metalloendopeptidase family protein [Thermocrinis albus]ADC88797.1 Peptidase M23 [Thermocrinis albus DSM 14484]